MKDNFKKILDNFWLTLIIIFIIVFGLWFLLSLVWPESFMPQSLQKDINGVQKDTGLIPFIYYYLTITTSSILIYVAYYNLNRANREIEAKFLFDIDKRWGEPQIIKAREVIQEIHAAWQLKYKEQEKSKECIRNLFFSSSMINLSESTDKESIKKYVCLINFLDFMETIGYLYSEDYITKKQLDELCGSSILYNFEIFKGLITHKREKRCSPSEYKMFEILYLDLRKEKVSRLEV